MKPGMALLARRYCQHGSLPKISLQINNSESYCRKLYITHFYCIFPIPKSNHLSQNYTKAVKTHDDMEIAPRKCFGALSPKYMGCTFMLIPAKYKPVYVMFGFLPFCFHDCIVLACLSICLITCVKWQTFTVYL